MQQPLSPGTRPDGRQPRHRVRSIHALLLGIVAALGLTALSAAPALAAPTPGGATGSFTVPAGVDASNVNVELVTASGNGYDTAAVTGAGTTGTYTFTDEAPGQYYVYFTAATGTNVQTDYYGDGGTDDIQKATLITIPAGGTATVGNAALSTGATVSGTLTDPNATSESSATVFIDPVYTGADLDPTFFDSQSVRGAGSYSFTGLPAGTYRVEYQASGTTTAGVNLNFDVYVDGSGVTYDQQSATQYAIAAGSTTTANLTVSALGTVSGTVTGPAGPVYDDEVQLVDSLEGQANFDAAGFTAGDGTYSILVLPGTYKVDFDGMEPQNLAPSWYGAPTEAGSTAITVAAGATVANINETLSSGATISGTVAAAQGGAVLGGLDVELLDAQGNDVEDTTAQPNGTYTLTNVPAGTWYVKFNGGIADNSQYYASEFYGGTQSEFGSTPITTTAGQAVTGINGALLPAGATALGMPKESSAALSGLHNDKVALKFKVAAGTGAGYLHTLTVGLPKGFSWNRKKLSADLSLGAGITYTDAITSGKLVITLTNGEPAVSFALKAGGITVTKAIEKAAGGTTKKTKKKKKHALALAAKAKKKTKSKDTIKSETINLAVSDTAGVVTSLPFTVNKPH